MDLSCILTCYHCRGEFMHPDAGPACCLHCGAPPLGIHGDGQLVHHQARPAPGRVEARSRPLPPMLQPVHARRDSDGMLRICYWRLTNPTTGKQYVTRRRLSAEAARGLDPNAQPVGKPEVIGSCGQASTSDFMGAPLPDPVGPVAAPRSGMLPGWRDAQQHQWSRDPGRWRRYR